MKQSSSELNLIYCLCFIWLAVGMLLLTPTKSGLSKRTNGASFISNKALHPEEQKYWMLIRLHWAAVFFSLFFRQFKFSLAHFQLFYMFSMTNHMNLFSSCLYFVGIYRTSGRISTLGLGLKPSFRINKASFRIKWVAYCCGPFTLGQPLPPISHFSYPHGLTRKQRSWNNRDEEHQRRENG